MNGGLTSQAKENGLGAAQQAPVQQKKLLRAPTLAELDSSDSEVRPQTHSSLAPSAVALSLPMFSVIKLGLKLIYFTGRETIDYLVLTNVVVYTE